MAKKWHSSWQLWLVGLPTAGLAGCLLLLCCVPPVSRDALTHHLALPRLYLEIGLLQEIPWIKFSYYPQLLQLLYLGAMKLGSDILPKLIHMAFGYGTAGLLFIYLKKRFSIALCLFGVLLFLSLPIVIRLSISAYVDLGLIFFSFSAVLALCKWIERGCQTGWLLIAGVLCGLALSTKYNGLITLFILTCSVPVLFIRHAPPTNLRQIKGLGVACIFLAVSLSLFSPWMIRNALWKGNPVYPLFNGVFNPQASQQECSLSPESAYWECQPRLGHFLKRKLLYDEAWWETALIPLRVFFQGRDHDPRLFDGRLNLLLLFLPLAAFCLPTREGTNEPPAHEKHFFLAFAVLFLLSVFLQRDMRIRYAGPMIPPLIILSVWGLRRLLDWRPFQPRAETGPRDLPVGTPGKAFSAWRANCLLHRSALLLVVVLLSWNMLYLAEQFQRVQPLGFLSGQTDRQAYILKRRPEYAVYRYANEHLPAEARLLGLFLGNRRYYLHRRTFCNAPYFKNLIEASASPEALAAALQADGISHILLSFPLFNDWVRRSLSPEEGVLVQSFFKQEAVKLAAEYGFGLYGLSRQGEKASRTDPQPEGEPGGLDSRAQSGKTSEHMSLTNPHAWRTRQNET